MNSTISLPLPLSHTHTRTHTSTNNGPRPLPLGLRPRAPDTGADVLGLNRGRRHEHSAFGRQGRAGSDPTVLAKATSICVYVSMCVRESMRLERYYIAFHLRDAVPLVSVTFDFPLDLKLLLSPCLGLPLDILCIHHEQQMTPLACDAVRD